MSSPAVHPSLVLTRRLVDGTIEWIPLAIPQHESATAGAAYALIDRSTGFAAPPLVARRVDQDLVVEVDGVEVLVVDGFFATTEVAFYPTPEIASGGGPFSGSPLTPEAPVLADSPAGAQVIWSAEPIGGELASNAETSEDDDTQDGGSRALLWGGLGLGALAIGAAAGGGGGGSSSAPTPTPTPGGGNPPPDTTPPQITSGATAGPIDENTGAGQVVYTAAATDTGTVAFNIEGADAALFNIDVNTGAVTLIDNPDFETQPSYNFTVVATDDAGNSSPQAVVLSINNTDDTEPRITSGATASTIDENSGAGQAVYAATADGPVTWSLQPGGDATDFTIDADSGAVMLVENPDQETQPSYNFTVIATDAAGNNSQQAVALTINDLDEVAPTITSASTAAPVDENSGAGQVVYTVTSTDTGDISTGSTIYSLKPGDDAADFTINAGTGAVTLIANPDFEVQSNYDFTVVATDTAGNSSERAISLGIDDVDESQPTVSTVTLTSVDAQNDTLDAGDVVRVTVTMSESIVVDTSSGTPRIALNVGGSTTFADYVSGSASTSLIFEYVVQPGDADGDGISIEQDALELNGGTLADAAGNAADLNHAAVPDDAALLVDTSAPTLTLSSPADDATAILVGADIVLTFSEDVQVGSGNITISDGGDTRIIDVTDGAQVSISGDQVTINPTADLNPDSSYNVQIDSGALTDLAGNDYAGISDAITLNFDTELSVDTSVVVFDLVQGSSSDHSGRIFQSNVSYDIYLRVDSDDDALSNAGGGPGTWGRWGGTINLGSDDRIIIVGDGAAVEGPDGPVTGVAVVGTAVTWETSSGAFAAMAQGRSLFRVTSANNDALRLFNQAVPDDFLAGQGGILNTMYFTDMPAGILTSQGLI